MELEYYTYDSLKTRVTEIIKDCDVNYVIKEEPHFKTDVASFTFIIENLGVNISYVTIFIREETVNEKGYNLRELEETDVFVFHITSVFTEEHYGGNVWIIVYISNSPLLAGRGKGNNY